MPIPRLRIEDTALLVIDVQERLMPTIAQADRMAANSAIMLKLAGLLGMPFLVTEQYPRGLGRTIEVVARAMPDPSQRVEKTRFSGLVELVDERLRGWSRSNILVCGIEAHVCVLQTVLDLQASGRQAYLVSDAVSASQSDQIAPAMQRMERSGAIITGVMSSMYELLRDASHPQFRQCLDLAKAIQ